MNLILPLEQLFKGVYEYIVRTKIVFYLYGHIIDKYELYAFKMYAVI